MKERVNPLLLWGNFYAFVVTGMAVLITGSILPYLIDEFSLRYDQGGLLLSLQAIGNLAASIAGGIVSDFIGRKATLAFGALCFVVGFGGAVIISSSTLLFIFLFAAGIGWGIMNSLVNAVVSDATNGKSSTMNLLHMFFAVGAFASPFIVGLMVKLGLNWRYAVITVAFASVVLFFVFLFMPIESPVRRSGRDKPAITPFKNIRYYLFMAILFMYVGTENSINGWIVTYLSESMSFNLISPQDVLSLFWIAIIVGRLLGAYFSRFFSKEALLSMFGLGGAGFFIIFLLTGNQALIIMSVFAMGLMYAGVYPTTVANASTLIKGSGAAAGIMLSFGGLGGAAVPYINGLVAESRGLYAGMTIIVVSALILGAAALLNLWMRKSRL